MPKANALRTWFKNHTPDQRAELAKKAGTSVPYLRHVIAGRRKLSAELAIALECASWPFEGAPLHAADLSPVLKAYFKAIGI